MLWVYHLLNAAQERHFLVEIGVNLKTKLITREGYNKLKQEHDYLWNEKRPEITKIVTWAASLGDRSENADRDLVVELI